MRLGRFHRRRSGQSGYILITIMFLMVLLVIAMLATAPAVKTQLQRDREEEMIHRGAQYSRAIKRYFKKFGRYPTSLEQLENTNNLRFLRKQYKDPMVADGKWRLLHFGDVKIGTASNIGTPVSAMGTMGGPSGSLGQPAGQTPSAFGASPGGFGSRDSSGTTIQPSTTSFGGLGSQPSTMISGGLSSQPSTMTSGGLSSQPSTATAGGSSSMRSSTAAIGAGALIGVASLNEKEGLHEFNEKTHYNEWYFVFDPAIDTGGLIRGPYTGKTFVAAGGVGNVPGMGTQGQQPDSFGQPSSLGQPSSFGQPSSLGQPSSFGQPQQQPQTPR
jgi:type II secretory pathway pseudopilin PulG